jgi:hypothetical protein
MGVRFGYFPAQNCKPRLTPFPKTADDTLVRVLPQNPSGSSANVFELVELRFGPTQSHFYLV